MSGYWKVPRYEYCVCFLIKLHSIQQLNTSVNGVAPILLNLHACAWSHACIGPVMAGPGRICNHAVLTRYMQTYSMHGRIAEKVVPAGVTK